LVFPYVTETLRTEIFLTKKRWSGCFSLTDVVAEMNSGIRVRESIRFSMRKPSVREDVQQKDGRWTATLERRRRVKKAPRHVPSWYMGRPVLQ
jgi:hypothetical protein